MRTGTLVLVAYLACVVVAAAWRIAAFGPLHDAIPDLGALTAAYLGLTSRRQIAPAVAGSVVLGYLIDLVSGVAPGYNALVLGLTVLVARAVQQRIYVRGLPMTLAFSAFVALAAGVLGLAVRALYRMPHPTLSTELAHIAIVIVATALAGPLVWRVFRRIDAAYARTHRERDAALEGLAP
jgi:cell shape-determining protein MreD